MEWVTTSTMLDRMRRFDDKDVWGRFHERFRRPLLAFARRYGLSDAEAEDVSQEILAAFLEAYRDGEYERDKGRLNTWLFGIAYRQIANRRRAMAQEAERRDERGGHASFMAEVPEEGEAQQAWDAEWEAATLESCLRQARQEVSEKTFEAFRLIVRENRSPDEAAAALEMSREAVYVAKHRVLKRLAELMQEYEHFRVDA